MLNTERNGKRLDKGLSTREALTNVKLNTSLMNRYL
jgi:hypothetical protein